jgi:aerobic C4-dicarboxylate transport protein
MTVVAHGNPADTDPHHAPRGRTPLWRQLWLWVAAAMVIGVILGMAAPQTAVAMQPLGEGFIRLISMMIGPLIFCTIVNGVANMADMHRVGRIAVKALVVFEAMTLGAVILALVAANVLKPGVGMNLDLASLKGGANLGEYMESAEHFGFASFLLNIIPKTFLGAFVQGNVLQVLFLAILSGSALIWLGEKARPLLNVLDAALQMIFRIVAMVMWMAPVGAFGAIAFTVGKFGVGTLASLGTLVGEFYLVCVLFILLAATPIAWWCGFSLWRFLKLFRDELLITVATTSSETVLPRIMTKLEDVGCERALVGFVVPAGYSFNLTGACLYLGMVTIFLAQATNTPMDLWHQLGLLVLMAITSKGAAGIAGAAFVVLTATIAMDHTIPVASVALMLGIHRLMSQGFSPTFIITNAVSAMAVAKWEGALDEQRMKDAIG